MPSTSRYSAPALCSFVSPIAGDVCGLNTERLVTEPSWKCMLPHSPSHVVHTERKIHTPNSARVRKRLFLYIHDTYSSSERFCVCVLYACVRVSYFSCKCEWYWHFYMKLASGPDLSVINSPKFVVISWRLLEDKILVLCTCHTYLHSASCFLL